VSSTSQAETRSFWQSPRFQQRVFWVALVVFIGGVIAFTVTHYWNTGNEVVTPVNPKAPVKDVSGTQKSVTLPNEAKTVAQQFILTAVARQNLDDAWKISGPHIRQGMTHKEWLTGNIPVVPYPADAIGVAPMKIDYSYKDEALLEVALLPKKGAKIKPQIFFLGLIRTGPPGNKHWVVDSWVPRASPQVPSGAEHSGS
jgi:hypothetical protein